VKKKRRPREEKRRKKEEGCAIAAVRYIRRRKKVDAHGRTGTHTHTPTDPHTRPQAISFMFPLDWSASEAESKEDAESVKRVFRGLVEQHRGSGEVEEQQKWMAGEGPSVGKHGDWLVARCGTRRN